MITLRSRITETPIRRLASDWGVNSDSMHTQQGLLAVLVLCRVYEVPELNIDTVRPPSLSYERSPTKPFTGLAPVGRLGRSKVTENKIPGENSKFLSVRDFPSPLLATEKNVYECLTAGFSLFASVGCKTKSREEM